MNCQPAMNCQAVLCGERTEDYDDNSSGYGDHHYVMDPYEDSDSQYSSDDQERIIKAKLRPSSPASVASSQASARERRRDRLLSSTQKFQQANNNATQSNNKSLVALKKERKDERQRTVTTLDPRTFARDKSAAKIMVMNENRRTTTTSTRHHYEDEEEEADKQEDARHARDSFHQGDFSATDTGNSNGFGTAFEKDLAENTFFNDDTSIKRHHPPQERLGETQKQDDHAFLNDEFLHQQTRKNRSFIYGKATPSPQLLAKRLKQQQEKEKEQEKDSPSFDEEIDFMDDANHGNNNDDDDDDDDDENEGRIIMGAARKTNLEANFEKFRQVYGRDGDTNHLYHQHYVNEQLSTEQQQPMDEWDYNHNQHETDANQSYSSTSQPENQESYPSTLQPENQESHPPTSQPENQVDRDEKKADDPYSPSDILFRRRSRSRSKTYKYAEGETLKNTMANRSKLTLPLDAPSSLASLERNPTAATKRTGRVEPNNASSLDEEVEDENDDNRNKQSNQNQYRRDGSSEAWRDRDKANAASSYEEEDPNMDDEDEEDEEEEETQATTFDCAPQEVSQVFSSMAKTGTQTATAATEAVLSMVNSWNGEEDEGVGDSDEEEEDDERDNDSADARADAEDFAKDPNANGDEGKPKSDHEQESPAEVKDIPTEPKKETNKVKNKESNPEQKQANDQGLPRNHPVKDSAPQPSPKLVTVAPTPPRKQERDETTPLSNKTSPQNGVQSYRNLRKRFSPRNKKTLITEKKKAAHGVGGGSVAKSQSAVLSRAQASMLNRKLSRRTNNKKSDPINQKKQKDKEVRPKQVEIYSEDTGEVVQVEVQVALRAALALIQEESRPKATPPQPSVPKKEPAKKEKSSARENIKSSVRETYSSRRNKKVVKSLENEGEDKDEEVNSSRRNKKVVKLMQNDGERNAEEVSTDSSRRNGKGEEFSRSDEERKDEEVSAANTFHIVQESDEAFEIFASTMPPPPPPPSPPMKKDKGGSAPLMVPQFQQPKKAKDLNDTSKRKKTKKATATRADDANVSNVAAKTELSLTSKMENESADDQSQINSAIEVVAREPDPSESSGEEALAKTPRSKSKWFAKRQKNQSSMDVGSNKHNMPLQTNNGNRKAEKKTARGAPEKTGNVATSIMARAHSIKQKRAASPPSLGTAASTRVTSLQRQTQTQKPRY